MTDFAAQGDPSRTAFIEFAQLVPRDVRPDELPELRSIYWHQAALGHRLPAEIGVNCVSLLQSIDVPPLDDGQLSQVETDLRNMAKGISKFRKTVQRAHDENQAS